MTLLHVRSHHLHLRSIGDPGAGRDIDVAAALARTDLPDPDGLWFIDRLDARACGRADFGGRTVAELLARQIAHAVRDTLDGGPGQDGVRWFPDRATYLAQWLLDLSHGQAGKHWEYAQFDNLAFSPALRERAGAEPACVLAALRSLPGAELDRMLGLLAPADAASVVHALAAGSRPADRRELARTTASLWRAGRLPRDPRTATLAVLLALDAAPPGPDDATAARDLALLCAALRDRDPAGRDRLLAAVRAADVRALAASGQSALAAAFAGWSRSDLADAVTALAADRPGERGPAPDRTTLGGAFLLLPLLAELPLADATSEWPDPPGADAAALTGALATGAVLGVGPDVLADPWTRLALGLPADVAEHTVGWSGRVTRRDADRFVRRFATLVEHRRPAVTGDLGDRSLLLDPPLAAPLAEAVRVAAGVLVRELSHRLPGQAHAGIDHLRRNVLTFGATVRVDDDAITVQLDPPPLGVLLSLTGMNRRRFTMPATGERPWLLTQRP